MYLRASYNTYKCMRYMKEYYPLLYYSPHSTHGRNTTWYNQTLYYPSVAICIINKYIVKYNIKLRTLNDISVRM